MKVGLLLVLLAIGGRLNAQTLQPVPDSSKVEFRIRNFGLNVNGSFKGIKGTITVPGSNLAGAVFDVTVDAATVETGIGMRDDHLRKTDYFDVAKFPVIRIKSTEIKPMKVEGNYTFNGTLTIKDVTKPLSFSFKAIRTGNGFVFTGGFKINRRDFGVGGNSISMSDETTVNLAVLAR